MSSGLKRTGRRSEATPFAGGRLPQFATVRELDLDAARYLAAVDAADGARLEPAVRAAVNAFVVGCKADSIWTPIKASCILAGARTLSGALVPLVGAAPTNNNFASGDYARRTGLVGDGSSKWLNSNRNNNADPQNSCHFSVYATSVGAMTTTSKVMFGSQIAGTNEKLIFVNSGSNSGNVSFRCQDTAAVAGPVGARAAGLIGASRATSGSYTARNNGTSATVTATSAARSSGSLAIFATFDGTTGLNHDDSRLAFYSIGESLDLAKLDTRVTTLINAISAAIP